MNGPIAKLSSVVAAQSTTWGLPVIYYKIVETYKGYDVMLKIKIWKYEKYKKKYENCHTWISRSLIEFD